MTSLTRYYHLFAKGETVKEIDQSTYLKYMNWNMLRISNKRMLCRVHNKEMYISKTHGLFVSLQQIHKILKSVIIGASDVK